MRMLHVIIIRMMNLIVNKLKEELTYFLTYEK
jgi:hypothetical protein